MGEDINFRHLQVTLLGEHGADGIVQEPRGSQQPESKLRRADVQDDVVEEVGVHPELMFEAEPDGGYVARQPPDPQEEYRGPAVLQGPSRPVLSPIEHGCLPTLMPARSYASEDPVHWEAVSEWRFGNAQI